MQNRTRAALALALVALVGCEDRRPSICGDLRESGYPPPFVCHNDSVCSCGGEGVGRCWHSPDGYDTCAYPDADCPTGWRWEDLVDLYECVAPEDVCPSNEPNACN